MKTQFISEDNHIFDNALDCARHEIIHIEGLLDKINKNTSKESQRTQGIWCNPSGGCACMGCINHTFNKINLTKEHWQVWNDEFRVISSLGQELESDSSMDYESTSLILKDVGDNKKAVILAIRRITGVGVIEASNIAHPGGMIKECIDYIDAKAYKKEMEKSGAIVEIIPYSMRLQPRPY